MIGSTKLLKILFVWRKFILSRHGGWTAGRAINEAADGNTSGDEEADSNTSGNEQQEQQLVAMNNNEQAALSGGDEQRRQ